MKWEDFQKLSHEKREEYQFKFGNKPFMMPFKLQDIITAGALYSVIIMTLYLIIKDETFSHLKPYVYDIISAIFNLTLTWGVIILIQALIFAVGIGFHYYKEYQWKKENLKN